MGPRGRRSKGGEELAFRSSNRESFVVQARYLKEFDTLLRSIFLPWMCAISFAAIRPRACLTPSAILVVMSRGTTNISILSEKTGTIDRVAMHLAFNTVSFYLDSAPWTALIESNCTAFGNAISLRNSGVDGFIVAREYFLPFFLVFLFHKLGNRAQTRVVSHEPSRLNQREVREGNFERHRVASRNAIAGYLSRKPFNGCVTISLRLTHIAGTTRKR